MNIRNMDPPVVHLKLTIDNLRLDLSLFLNLLIINNLYFYLFIYLFIYYIYKVARKIICIYKYAVNDHVMVIVAFVTIN